MSRSYASLLIRGWLGAGLILLATCARPTLVPLDLNYPTKPVQLPQDLTAHEWAQMEWWYYTGHLETAEGQHYGFELTFFRRRTDRDRIHGVPIFPGSRHAFMAHFAVVDESSGRYQHWNRIAPGGRRAHASAERYEVAMDNWSVSGDETAHRLEAKKGEVAIRLELKPEKPVALHGESGIVPKGRGLANYYFSYPRMQAQGTLTIKGREMAVTGLAWFDHEYGYMGETALDGWDWWSMQLEDRTEYMIYAVRDVGGKMVPESRACRIDPAGREDCVPFSEAKVEVLSRWLSPKNQGLYPTAWHIVIARFGLDVIVTAQVADQEFRMGKFGYWEGSCAVRGTPANGMAYVELVGYRPKKASPGGEK
jgi:predicted secreted hydrolase